MRRQKIVFVIGSMDRGGAEMHLVRIAGRIDQLRFETSIFLFANRGELAELLPKNVTVTAPWLPLKSKRPGFVIRAVRLFVSSIQFGYYVISRHPDIVHFFLPSSYLHGGTIAVLLRRRNLVMSRRSLNVYQERRPGWMSKLERRLHRAMAAILGNSKAVIRQLVEEENCPAENTFLIYNGVELPDLSVRDRALGRRSLGIEQDAIVLVMVANLFPYKGHLDALKACAMLPADRKWEMFFMGRDAAGMRAELVRAAADLGVADKVRIVGNEPDIGRFLSVADIGVLASHEEGFSNAILECMSYGLPMVVTNVGGNPEAVIDGENGYVVPPQSPSELAKALFELMENGPRRRKFGEAARLRIKDHFSLARCVSQYEDLYENIISGRVGQHIDGQSQ